MFATGMPVIDAHEDFARARRAHIAARAARWLHSGPRVPRTLSEASGLPSGRPRFQVIPLAEIVGTVDPTLSFDAAFRPATNLLRERWERVALAHRRGIALPPISVVRHHDGYYVIDGRHRVSVARALGHRDIGAWVTGAQAQLRGGVTTEARPRLRAAGLLA
jgi:ParB-like nuclease domain